MGLLGIYWGSLSDIKNKVDNRYNDLSLNEKEVANYISAHTDKQDKIYTHRLNGIIYLYSDRLSSTTFFFVP